MSNHDYLYTRDMIESGRTADFTAGERLREAADLRRTEAKETGTHQLVVAGRAHGHTIALRQVLAEMNKLADEPGRTDEHKLLLSILLLRIMDLKP